MRLAFWTEVAAVSKPSFLALLLMVALFYGLHARHELARIWRHHARRSKELKAQGLHFRRALEYLAALGGSLIILSPAIYYTFDACDHCRDMILGAVNVA